MNEYSLIIFDELDKIENINDKDEMEKLLEMVMRIEKEKGLKLLLVMSESLFNLFKDVQQQHSFENFNFNHYQLSKLTNRDVLLFFLEQFPVTKPSTPNLESLLGSIRLAYDKLILNSSIDSDITNFLDICARYPRLLRAFEQLVDNGSKISFSRIAKWCVCNKDYPKQDSKLNFIHEFRTFQDKYRQEQKNI